MARIDELLTQVTDKALRLKLETALADVKRKQRFGLVFEEHVPETTALLRFPVVKGATVQRKADTDAGKLYQVREITVKKATIDPEAAAIARIFPPKN